jgi:hypothetical protein
MEKKLPVNRGVTMATSGVVWRAGPAIDMQGWCTKEFSDE